MNENLTKGLVVGYFAATSFVAGYFVNKALEKKADDLVCETDSMAKAFIIGAGHMAVSIVAGLYVGGMCVSMVNSNK